MESELPEEFKVHVGVHQGYVLPLVFGIAVGVITESAREGLMNKILYADYLVLMSESIENLGVKLLKWNDAFESRGLKVNLKKTQSDD